MGWDAYAEPVERLWEHKHGRNGLANPVYEEAFKAAETRVREHAGSVDGFLYQAGLDVSDCERALHAATSGNTYPDGPRHSDGYDWTPEQVKHYAEIAAHRWDSLLLDHEPWAVWSAREFLETCARLGLGVRFSW